MKLVVNEDGFMVDTQQGLLVFLDNDRVVFTGDSTADFALPVDNIVELADNLNLAYKLLIRARVGDVKFKAQPKILSKKSKKSREQK